MNKAILFGNVGKDPEVRSLNDGTKAATFSMATNEVWKDKQSGERKERTEWHRIVAFGPIAETIAQYVRKGTKLLVEGKVQTRKWVDQSGTERFTTEIKMDHMSFAGSADRNEQDVGGPAGDREPQQRKPRAGVSHGSTSSSGSSLGDDEIPW